eukprot:gene13192-15586_t
MFQFAAYIDITLSQSRPQQILGDLWITNYRVAFLSVHEAAVLEDVPEDEEETPLVIFDLPRFSILKCKPVSDKFATKDFNKSPLEEKPKLSTSATRKAARKSKKGLFGFMGYTETIGGPGVPGNWVELKSKTASWKVRFGFLNHARYHHQEDMSKLLVPSVVGAEACSGKLLELLSSPIPQEKSFAFFYCPLSSSENAWGVYDAHKEFKRQGVGQVSDTWRATAANKDFKLCHTYPKVLYVPSSVSDDMLMATAEFRSGRRLPVLTYHHTNGTVLCRSSQPLIGWTRNRSEADEKLVRDIQTAGLGRLHIIDARPLANATANAMK